MWIAQGRSYPGLADRPPRPTEPPDNLSLQSRTHVILEEEEEEKESPSFGSCRPLSQVADSGPKAKVNYPIISALPSLKLYPGMCGHILEPDTRPGLRPVNVSSAATNASVHALADDPGDRQERPQPGSADGPGQPRELQQGPPTSRERPNKGSAEDLKQPKKLQQGLLQPHH